MISMDEIHTDERGVPFERPEHPGPHATWAQISAYWQACDAYRDRVVGYANKVFAEQFRKSLRSAR